MMRFSLIHHHQKERQPSVWLAALTLLGLAFAGCSGSQPVAPSLPAPVASRAASATHTALPPSVTPSPFIPASATPRPTATPVPPPTFAPTGLYKGVQPVSYLTDTCQYLQMRWDPENSQPGTVLAPVMFHSILKYGKSIKPDDYTSITQEQFAQFMEHAKKLGYQTVTAEQAADFLEKNAKIPPRSLLLIVDDRRLGVVREHFLPYLQQYKWTVTLAYIPGAAMAYEWKEIAELQAGGWIDVQAHGFLHNADTYIKSDTPESVIHSEIYDPIPVLQEKVGYRPTAFIWPGGDFNHRSVEVAREAGYRLGFTVYSRGPIMFNWIPLGEEERSMGDPLLVLPRFWSTAAWVNLDEAARIGDQAKADAETQKASELAWMQAHCP